MIEMPFWLFVGILAAWGVFCIGAGIVALLAWVGWKWGSEP